MAGATANHNRLTINLWRLFPLEVAGQSYEIFSSDMRVWFPEVGNYVYPDVLAVAGEPSFTNDKKVALTNLCLIVEVSSDSPAVYDKWEKFQLYRSLPTLAEYVVVDQKAIRVMHYTKVATHQWLMTELRGNEAVLQLPSVPVAIALSDLI